MFKVTTSRASIEIDVGCRAVITMRGAEVVDPSERETALVHIIMELATTAANLKREGMVRDG